MTPRCQGCRVVVEDGTFCLHVETFKKIFSGRSNHSIRSELESSKDLFDLMIYCYHRNMALKQVLNFVLETKKDRNFN